MNGMQTAINANVGYASGAIIGGGSAAQNGAGNPVPTALNSMDKAGAYLHDRLTLLEQRLAAVLAPLPPTPVGNDVTGKLARHSLALMIESNAASTAEAAHRIDSLINRLEL
jgi:hypothetical protein